MRNFKIEFGEICQRAWFIESMVMVVEAVAATIVMLRLEAIYLEPNGQILPLGQISIALSEEFIKEHTSRLSEHAFKSC